MIDVKQSKTIMVNFFFNNYDKTVNMIIYLDVTIYIKKEVILAGFEFGSLVEFLPSPKLSFRQNVLF